MLHRISSVKIATKVLNNTLRNPEKPKVSAFKQGNKSWPHNKDTKPLKHKSIAVLDELK